MNAVENAIRDANRSLVRSGVWYYRLEYTPAYGTERVCIGSPGVSYVWRNLESGSSQKCRASIAKWAARITSEHAQGKRPWGVERSVDFDTIWSAYEAASGPIPEHERKFWDR